MKLKYVEGDLLESNVDAFAHVANSHHTFGAGIAYFIKKRYPQAFEADLQTPLGDSKLGTFSKAIVFDKTIYNLYAMNGIGNDGNPLNRNLQYDHFHDGLYKICEDVCRYNPTHLATIGLPYKIGSDRAGGNWNIVEKIIEEVQKQFEGKLNMVIYHLSSVKLNSEI